MSQLHHRLALVVLAALGFGASHGCASGAGGSSALSPVRISHLVDRGGEAADAARRASLLLVGEGLASDSRGLSRAALARYERALQVDATNPYAYLAISRHHVEARDPTRALQFLDHAESLLRMDGDLPDEVRVHLLGLRGAALYDLGEFPQAAGLLDRARALSPVIWGDGSLDSDELR
jgi:tetratricopeptide (TPR) repeat protein